jgi:hypothetical protein
MREDKHGGVAPLQEEPAYAEEPDAPQGQAPLVRKIGYVVVGVFAASLTVLIIRAIAQHIARRDSMAHPRITSIHKPDVPAPLRRPPGPIAVARAPVIAAPAPPAPSPGPGISFTIPGLAPVSNGAPLVSDTEAAAPVAASVSLSLPPRTPPAPVRVRVPLIVPLKRATLPVKHAPLPVKHAPLPTRRATLPVKHATLPVQKSVMSRRPTLLVLPPQPARIDLDAPPLNEKNEVEPAWWPCREGQIKGNRDSMKYHVPGGRFYTKTYEGIDCFDTEEEARAAGFTRSKR